MKELEQDIQGCNITQPEPATGDALDRKHAEFESWLDNIMHRHEASRCIESCSPRGECTFDRLVLKGRASCAAAAVVTLRLPLPHDLDLDWLSHGAP